MMEETPKLSKNALKKKLKAKKKDTDRLQCQYILQHKAGKQCNMTRGKGELFCAQHKDSVGGRKRVPCPLDNSHNVWEDQVEHHLAKCQAKPSIPTDEWYRLDLNIASKDSEESIALNAQTETEIDLAKWTPILSKLYEKEVKSYEVVRDIRQNVGLEERLSELGNKKHAIQQSSLVGHMADNGLLYDEDNKTDRLIIEFGCGRAELSRYISRSQLLNRLGTSSAVGKNRFLLIDRSNPRNKFDCKLVEDYEKLKEEKNDNKLEVPEYQRIKIDIKDLDLDKTLFISKANGEATPLKVTAVSKHLCGCATDLTLACLKNSSTMAAAASHNSHGASLEGIVIALCCRQLCSYQTYPISGRKWLEENGIDREGFRAIAKMTSWAVCGSREQEAHEEDLERERIGLMARRVIDFGRLKSLREMGYNAKVVEYVDKSVSLENHCLVVTGINSAKRSYGSGQSPAAGGKKRRDEKLN